MPARILRLTQRFNREVRRLGAIAGSPSGRALSVTLSGMLNEALPGPLDAETLYPPVRRYWFRRIQMLNLWVYFRFDETELVAVDLSAQPPVPVID